MESFYKTVNFSIDLLITPRQYYSEIEYYVTRGKNQPFRTSAVPEQSECRYWNLSTGWCLIKYGEVKEMTGVYAYTDAVSAVGGWKSNHAKPFEIKSGISSKIF